MRKVQASSFCFFDVIMPGAELTRIFIKSPDTKPHIVATFWIRPASSFTKPFLRTSKDDRKHQADSKRQAFHKKMLSE